MNWIEPITDRTELDLANRSPKAFLNAADLNRIEGNAAWMAQALVQYSVPILGQAKSDWDESEVPTSADIRRICDNVAELQDKYYRPRSSVDIPDLGAKPLHYADVNNLELNLLLLKQLLDEMVTGFKKASFKSGQAVFLPKRRAQL